MIYKRLKIHFFMVLKELKQEIDGLESFDKQLIRFRQSWIKQIGSRSNSNFPFLKKLDCKTKKEINNNLENCNKIYKQLRQAKFTHEKISSLAHYLIQLKLASFNGDNIKPKMLVSKFIDDDFLKLTNVINEIDQFDFNLKNLKKIYDKTNQIVSRKVTLEKSVIFNDSPHLKNFNEIMKTHRQQKKLLKTLGEEFIKLAKEMKKQKRL